MAIRVGVNHKTTYQYDRLISLSPHIFRLRPAVHSRTPIEAFSLKIEPANHFINWQQDPFGNFLARVVFPEKTRQLAVEVDLVAQMTVINPFDFFVEEYADQIPFSYDRQLKKELVPYLEARESGPLLMKRLETIDRSPMQVIDFLVALNQQVWKDIGYTIRMEPGVQTCEQTLSKKTGSCRDSAWLLVQVLRHLGLAARFVSGYLVQLTADEKSLDGPSGPEKDFTDLHAWAEVYIPGAGWLGLDPTSGLFAGEGHIPLACTPDPVSAAPVTGATDKCEVHFSFTNSVRRIHEDPRVTKPYSDIQWQAINALGQTVEQKLADRDVRLSMGGEPTFVSIDDMESPEWNTRANGVHKRKLAGDLLNRLFRSFAQGGMRHYGQGKWYPGEELPRWALGCFWRRDGVPVWQNPDLLARDGKDYGHTVESAEKFIRHLTGILGLADACICPGFEDVFYMLWQESNLPVDIDPLKSDLKDPLERQRLARQLQGDPGAPAGYALPIEWNFVENQWVSRPWRFRQGHMFLIPGDSPMGLRLPLDALPWAVQKDDSPMPERSLMEDLPGLPAYSELPVTPAPGPGRPAGKPGKMPHTAMCVEAREGRIHIFMPPTGHLEPYLALVAAVEQTAAALDLPVVIEGYEPPKDNRMESLKVTPDPGVIEVNIHPSPDWHHLVKNITTLYEQARLARLATEKFMLDGRHTGTGGGNHVTIGGPTPADSPMLRRPDLLRSLVTYWQHHPGLSYLFSGQFIGPTSQAPRADEGRNEQLYELEIAFGQIPESGPVPNWLVDRVFRNLLTDITGNTHRAEFCIDKLFSPDSLSGRLGLVEFRAFDMPPHARMSVVQMLLIRALIARFWETPYKKNLVRWGTELHDRWMLPHFVVRDLEEVAQELQSAGFPFDPKWLAPFVEFRFPHYGTVRIRDIALELRQAIEPWHVLGEEVSRTGTSRFVDSSLERLQIRATGLTDGRYVVACNGRRVLLHNTGTQGEYVGGVRYRAWQPPSALHPTIGVHSPLVFDLIDTWNGRSLGGCTYHVMHPGGRNYDTFPVNAYEAEARRFIRFWSHGHTPAGEPSQPLPPGPFGGGRFTPKGSGIGPAAVPGREGNPEYPYTLDLRLTPNPTNG